MTIQIELSGGTVHCGVQGGSNFGSLDKILKYDPALNEHYQNLDFYGQNLNTVLVELKT